MITKIPFLALVLLTNSMYTCAQFGTLDGDFDSDGRVITDFYGFTDRGNDVAIQSDGKILVVGEIEDANSWDFGVIRYWPDGSPDNSFSFNGNVSIDFDGSTDKAHAVAIQSDGKIVVVGDALVQGDYDFGIVRLHADGSLDQSFDIDGKKTIHYGGNAANSFAYDVKIDGNGRILIVGRTNYSVTGYDFEIMCLNPDGSVDNNFGTLGHTHIDLGGSDEYWNALELLSDGRIIAVGYSNSSGNFELAMLTSNGMLDNNFSGDGLVSTDFNGSSDFAMDVVQQADSKILVGGYAFNQSYDFAMSRYNLDGSLDNNLSFDGKLTSDLSGAESNDQASCILLQPDNKIILGGFSSNAGESDFGLVRYNSDGSLDNTFGSFGKVLTHMNSNDDGISAIALQSDLRLVAAGYSFVNFATARYLTGLNVGIVEFAQNPGLLIYPNPIEETTVLHFALAENETVSIDLIDANGALVQQIVPQSMLLAGEHAQTISISSELTAGAYFVVLSSPKGKTAIKVLKR
jgi:uncharacterized delta-60 repeat protein